MATPQYSAAVREYKTVRLWRTSSGFGFSLTGQYPCVLTHVVEGSPAFKAGLKVGDYLIMVNGMNVVKFNHDAVVSMVAGCAEYVILQVAQRTVSAAPAGVQCTCSLNCQSLPVAGYKSSCNNPAVAGKFIYQQPRPPNFAFEGCGVVYVGFLKLPLPANPNAAVFTRLLSSSLNHFLMNKSLILMQPLTLSTNRQAICLSDNKNGGYNFILNSVAFVGTIPESPSNMFGLVLHCPPNPICVCHLFSTSLTRPQEQYLRLKSPSYYSAPEVVQYLNYLIASVTRNQPLCDASNYPSYNASHQNRRMRNQQPPNFEAEIFIDNFQFPVGGVYTVSDRNAAAGSSARGSDDHARTRGKPPKCGCNIGRVTSNASSASSATHGHEHRQPSNAGFDGRQAAMALARSRSLSRYHRKGMRGGSSRSSGSDDGRFGRGGGSSGGSGSLHMRYGSQRSKNHRHRKRQDSLSGGSGRMGISDETTTTTSTTTDYSSTAHHHQHYGQLWQSGSSSLYRSRSIDSLINASKEEAVLQSSSSNKQAATKFEKRGGHFSVKQQQQAIIDSRYVQVDQIEQQQGPMSYFQQMTVSTENSGLALNSLLSPRYHASFGTNASETDLDYYEELDGEKAAAIATSAGRGNAVKAATSENLNGVVESQHGKQQQQHQLSQHTQFHRRHQQQQQQQQLQQGDACGGKRFTPAHTADACEARSPTASVETHTEVAGSTLSLPISSAASATGHKSVHPVTFEAILQDKAALELFRNFLKSQVSDENLEFLLACDNFRSLPAGEALGQEAKAIYQQFVSQHSKQPVNLTWQIVANIRRALLASNIRILSPKASASAVNAPPANDIGGAGDSGDMAVASPVSCSEVARDMYDAAREHTYRLLKKDCYPRFVQSDYYKELIGESKSATCSVDSASCQSGVEPTSGFKSSGLRLSSRKNRSRNTRTTSTTSSTSGAAVGSVTSSSSSNNGITWNPAKLLSHIIGRAKSKPSRHQLKGDIFATRSLRVTFPDGSVETVPTDEIKGGFVASLADCLGPLCASRSMSVFLCAIYQHGSEQPIDSQLSAASFNGRHLIVEQQAAFVVFYFSGNSSVCRRVLVRGKPCRRIADVLQWDERTGDDAVVIKEVHSVEPDDDGKFKLNSIFNGLVRDVQNRFVVVIAAGRPKTSDNTAVCNLVKSHFEINSLPKFEDVLNAVTSSHSWHTFDEYGRIDLAKAISPQWKDLRVSLAVGESPEAAMSAKDESDYLEGDDLAGVLSSLDLMNAQEPEIPTKQEVVNEPRSRRPVVPSTVASSLKQQFQCRLVRGAHPLGELLPDQFRGQTPSSIDRSLANDKNMANNMNYEIIDSHCSLGGFKRINSANDVVYLADGGSSSPGHENAAGQLGYDENSWLVSDETYFGQKTHQASPYARRLPRPAQLPKISVATDDAAAVFAVGSGLRSSTPSPSTHRLVCPPGLTTQSPASLISSSFHAETTPATVRITESTL